MNLLSDVITYVRRLIKSPSNAVISDNLIIDYIKENPQWEFSLQLHKYIDVP